MYTADPWQILTSKGMLRASNEDPNQKFIARNYRKGRNQPQLNAYFKNHVI
jgi:hypothetical protein